MGTDETMTIDKEKIDKVTMMKGVAVRPCTQERNMSDLKKKENNL